MLFSIQHKKRVPRLPRLTALLCAVSLLCAGGGWEAAALEGAAPAPQMAAESTTLQPFPDTSYQTWKQTDPRWRYQRLGPSSDTMAMSGCAVTSAAILCAASGAPVPPDFTPGVLCKGIGEAGGFSTTGLLTWTAITTVVPSFHFVKSTTITGKTVAAQTEEIAAALNAGYYVSVFLKTTRSTHFVAVNTVSDGIVRMFDPATKYDSLYAGYDASMVVGLRLFSADKAPAVVPPEDSHAAEYAIGTYSVTANLRLRDASSLSGKILGQLPTGTEVTVTAVSGEWGQCTWNGLCGWICLNYCLRVSALFAVGQYCTDGNSMNLRSAPTTDASVVGYLQPETVFPVTQISGDWGYCALEEKVGWVALRFCTCQSSTAQTPPPVEVVPPVTTPSPWTASVGDCVVVATALNVRQSADAAAQKLGQLPQGTVVSLLACAGDWGKIAWQDGTAWICLGSEQTPYLLTCGDLNQDGVRGEADEQLLDAFLQGRGKLTAIQLLVADWNADGMVNIGDLLRLRLSH